MTAKEAYEVWAPAGKKWVDWVRPVPFVGMGEYSKVYHISNITMLSVDDWSSRQVTDKTIVDGTLTENVDNVDNSHEETDGAVDNPYKDAAIIVDLPGAESVAEGLALARVGFRPIPVYNGTIEQRGARATVDNQSVGIALLWGAEELRYIAINEDALPAFLLDSNRLHRYKVDASIFDNSWDVYPQDLPTAEYFIDSGIHRIIIIGDRLSKDLKKILYGFQKKKIEIYLTNGYDTPKKIRILRPFQVDQL